MEFRKMVTITLYPVLSPEKFRGQRRLTDCSSWGHKESGRTEQTCIYIVIVSFFPVTSPMYYS